MIARRPKNILQEHWIPKVSQLGRTLAPITNGFEFSLSHLTMSFVESGVTAGSEELGMAAPVI
jgi:hypothetical protein